MTALANTTLKLANLMTVFGVESVGVRIQSQERLTCSYEAKNSCEIPKNVTKAMLDNKKYISSAVIANYIGLLPMTKRKKNG